MLCSVRVLLQLFLDPWDNNKALHAQPERPNITAANHRPLKCKGDLGHTATNQERTAHTQLFPQLSTQWRALREKVRSAHFHSRKIRTSRRLLFPGQPQPEEEAQTFGGHQLKFQEYTSMTEEIKARKYRCVAIPPAATRYFKSFVPCSYTVDLQQRPQARGRTEGHTVIHTPSAAENRLWMMQQLLSTRAPTKAPQLL